ncbi:glycosyltransferase [Peribacillus butanolivorans]|uniref:glycosyltransferase n=1 Tax=Peribacillus butanolivorans TaxID=421767 RepID=UPI0036C994FA
MKILFLVVNNYPNGDAGAVRQHAFAKILHSLGHDVTIISLNQAKNNEFQNYEGILYKTISCRYLECKKYLKEYFSESEVPDIMFLNTIPLPSFYYAKKYAIKNNVKLVHDCVEWYSLDEYPLFEINQFIRGYLANSIVNRFLLDKHFKVISISSYLDSYFKGKGISSLRIPVIMNVRQLASVKQQNNKKLQLTYAGSPTRKDYLTNIITAIEKLEETERERLDFTLLGVDETSLSRITQKPIGEIRKLGCVHALGRFPRNVVLKRLEETDFTILIRSEKARYAKAGFPTKVVESLSSATPVILNLTSDLGMYLRDRYNGLIISSEKPEDIVVTLRNALALSPEEIKSMYCNARKTAEENFDMMKYYGQLENFLEI